jgi:protein TonB
VRAFALVSLAIHGVAVLLLAQYGTPRALPEADGEPPGIVVMFSEGGGGEEAGRDSPEAPPDSADAEPEAAGEEPSQEAEAEPAEEQPPPQPEAPPSATASLPLPPPSPPPPPPQAAQPQPRAEPPAAPAGRGNAQAPPPGSQAEEPGEAAREGSAAFMLATREATIGRRVDPVWPIEARRARMQGRVDLIVTISPEGVPTAVDVARSSGHMLLDRAAQEALWQWRFDPARRGGVPVEDRIVIPIRFSLID